ncbi:hypothetical protein DFH08DRAFT_1089546 [Mycena albidolilacea]|uniref:TEA domain-containing protein n=1 Tax=Mycena albidolilacea TaxID=1033008 RepID=A0AAD6Z0X4_9AGAR|nr:hypothetical protein DFH08DRAFT_1089546 [Mycena albidolilacea]
MPHHDLPSTSAIPGRKCWKNIPKKTKDSRTEAVWSPVLEAALIEGLEKYRPTTCRRYTRPLLRFPKRNQYISDHIFTATGVRRTPKQVGSRLQQLRDTCCDERVLNLIFHGEYSPGSTTEPNTPSDSSMPLDSASPSPVASISDISDGENGLPPRTFVTIELVQPSSFSFPHQPTPRPSPTNDYHSHSVSLAFPSDIATNDPVLAFSTPHPISIARHYSYFRVLVGGASVHSEVTELSFAGTSTSAERTYTYTAKLIPGYWGQLCRSARLFQCVIEQDIMRTSAPFDMLPSAPGPGDQCIRGVSYEFCVSRSAPVSQLQPPSMLPPKKPVLRTTAPVFHPPSLPSEPPLPPGIPAVGSTSQQVPIALAPVKYLHPHTLSDSELEELSFYTQDGSYVVEPGLFAGTSFLTDAIPAPPSFTLPYDLHDDTSTYYPDIAYGSSADSTEFEWLTGISSAYDTDTTSTYNPSLNIWPDLNSNTF